MNRWPSLSTRWAPKPRTASLINARLAASGVIIEAGRISIVDATVVEAVRSGRTNPDPEGGNRVKEDARGRKRGTWGYLGFVACDEDQFIHATGMTPGHHGEIHELQGLIARAGGGAVYADSACSAAGVRKWMEDEGLVDCIQRKGYRNHPLPAPERARNAELAVTRALVEAIFGTMKDVWGLARSRFMGLGRNRCQWQLAAVTWNLAKAARFRARYGVI